MRHWVGVVSLALTLCLAGTAQANSLNNLLAGLNGIVTAPAEPVMHVVEPPEALQELPGGMWTARPVGFVSGTLMLVYQTVMGAVDVAFSPFWIIPPVSPEPRWEIVPGYEVEYE